MTLFKRLFIVLLFFVCIWTLSIQSRYVFAGVCDGTTNPACVYQEIEYTYEVCDELYPGGPVGCWDATNTELRCTIPQAGGGSCSCCYHGGCYLSCPGTNPTGGGEYSYSQGSYAGPSPTPTPTPVPGTIRARAVVVPSSASSCSAFTGNTNYVTSSVTFNPSGDSQNLPTDGSYATYSNQPVVGSFTTYSFNDGPPAGYILKLACWSRDTPAASSTGFSADLYPASTITWDLGYTDGTAWFQAIGGDTYAASAISSPIPVGTSPRYFNQTPTEGTAGVVTYGSTYDFDSSLTEEGEGYVSSPGWLVNEQYAQTDFYAIMYHRFGSPTADFTGDTTFTDELASRAGPYYVDGDLAITTTNWSVTDGENIIVLVNGDLTINRSIALSGTGFVSFIVNGDITVDPAIGVPYTSSSPVIEGVYITSSTGTFHSGASSSAGTERFVGEGIFIAGDFDLLRDLDSVGRNNTTSSELFIYNPQLLITMPDEMRDIPISWQEVAP